MRKKDLKEVEKMRVFIKLFAVIIIFVFAFYTLRCTLESVAYAGIAGTKHDLSSTGPGPIKSPTVTEKCVFCHTPHKSNPAAGPLWNRDLSTATYIVRAAGGSFLSSPSNPPDGSSKLCLSCHDGTVAIGLLLNTPGSGTTYPTPITMSGVTAEGKMPCGPSDFTCLGTDLSNHHPVSIVYNTQLYNDKTTQCNNCLSAMPIKAPAAVTAPVTLKPTSNTYGGQGGNGVQCRSCHDPHNNPYGKFLVLDYSGLNSDDLCLACHYVCPTTGCL